MLLVLLSSAIGFSQNDFESTSIHRGDITQIVENSDDAQQEFRASTKVSISTVGRTRLHHSIFDDCLVSFQATHCTHYDCYHQKHLSAKPSIRMFVDLGAFKI